MLLTIAFWFVNIVPFILLEVCRDQIVVAFAGSNEIETSP